MKQVVLDASALMTYFQARRGKERVIELLDQAREGKHELLMPVVNWGEVFYSIWHAEGEATARRKLHEIAQLPITIVPVNDELTLRAATLKAKLRMPYLDSFVAALADSLGAPVATTDPDFHRLRGQIDLEWSI